MIGTERTAIFKYQYQGITHFIPMTLLPLWAKLFCKKGWHVWDEVWSLHDHYLYCDACERKIYLPYDKRYIPGLEHILDE